VFRTDVKQRDPNTGIDHIRKIDAATYMPMLAGLRERMRKSGGSRARSPRRCSRKTTSAIGWATMR